MFRIGADPFRKGLSSPPSLQAPIHTVDNCKIAVSHTFDHRRDALSHVACSLHDAFVIEDAKIVATEQFTFLLNRFVRFKVSDVTIPGPQEVVNELYGRDIVQGKVVDITESGAQGASIHYRESGRNERAPHSSRRKGDWNHGSVSEVLQAGFGGYLT